MIVGGDYGSNEIRDIESFTVVERTLIAELWLQENRARRYKSMIFVREEELSVLTRAYDECIVAADELRMSLGEAAPDTGVREYAAVWEDVIRQKLEIFEEEDLFRVGRKLMSERREARRSSAGLDDND